jgi:anti-sigma regulatory factor (Ser/Thr protein kinase)
MKAARIGNARREVLGSRAFPAPTASLAAIRSFVHEWAARLGLSEDRIFRIKVAVSEVCANAIEHSGGDGDIDVRVGAGEGRFLVDILHPGRFQAKIRPNRQHRGMGMPLMVACADEVSFAVLPGGGTRVSLAMFLD